MNGNPLTVIARVKAKRGVEAEVSLLLRSLVEPSRRDPGCINYDLHQSPDAPELFLFHENWQSREHLDRHLAKPDLKATLSRVSELVAEPPEITVWHKIA